MDGTGRDCTATLEIPQLVILDKKACRTKSRNLSWNEKVSMIERGREACRLARESMRKHRVRSSPGAR